MTHHWDEFSKSLAEEPLARRESLRRLGLLFAGAVLSPLGVRTAWARGTDPCKSFFRCRNVFQQRACLAECNACHRDTSRLAGACGCYTCCAAAHTNCGTYCADLANDAGNCGACGHSCDDAGPNEFGVCLAGRCAYACYDGAARCADGFCHDLNWDPRNCGTCGNVCGESTPYCTFGECTECSDGYVKCGTACVDIWSDSLNCGACGNACEWDQTCYFGWCYNSWDWLQSDPLSEPYYGW